MKKFSGIFAFIILFGLPAYGQNLILDWVKPVPITDSLFLSNWSHPITALQSESIYNAASFKGKIDVDPGPDTFFLESFYPDKADIYLQQLDSAGNFVWANELIGPGNNTASKVAIDEKGNTYLTGRFTLSMDVDPSQNDSILHSSGIWDGFLVKYNANGDFQWARSFGGKEHDLVSSVGLNQDGGVFVAGSFKDTMIVGDGIQSFTLISEGLADIFLASINADGTYNWVKTWGGSKRDEASAMSITSNGEIILGGIFYDSLVVAPGLGIPNLYSTGDMEVFLMAITAQGTPIWAKRVGGTGRDGIANISLDQQNNIYFFGGYDSDFLDLDPGPGVSIVNQIGTTYESELYTAKLSSSGDFIWGNAIGLLSSQSRIESFSMTTDAFGFVYLTGTFEGLIDFDPGIDSFLLSGNRAQAFIQKMNPAGQFEWATYLPSTGTSWGHDLLVLPSGELYLTGQYSYQTDFSPGPDMTLLYNPSDYGMDPFVAKYQQCLGAPTDTLIQVSTCESYTSPSGFHVWTQTGLYTDTVDVCGNTISIDLEIQSSSSFVIDTTVCVGSFLFNGVELDSSGTFSQLLTNQAGCDSILTLNLTLLDSLNLGLSQSGTILSALATGVSYQWLDCEQNFAPIPGETSQQLQTSGLGSYAVILSNGLCSDTSACASFSVGLDGSFPTAWQLFPNPSQGLLHLKLDQVYEQVSVRVFTVLGQEISQQQLPSGSQEAVIVLPPQPGLYLIEVSADGQRSVAKVLRE